MNVQKTLRRNGVSSAPLEASEICRRALCLTKEEFLAARMKYVACEDGGVIASMLEERLSGKPLAHILGEWDFYGLCFRVSAATLIPRPDTETLVDEGLEFIKKQPPGARVLDLCCGSGCVGIAVAKSLPGTRAVLADCSEDALRIARENIGMHRLTKQIYALRLDALCGHSETLGAFDLILCNPPYISEKEFAGLEPSVRLYEPRAALVGGTDGLLFYRCVAPSFKAGLKAGGRLMFECGRDQAAAVAAIMEEAGYEDIRIRRDLSGIERIVAATPAL